MGENSKLSFSCGRLLQHVMHTHTHTRRRPWKSKTMNPPNHSVDLLSLYLPPSPSPRRVLRGSRLQAIGAGLHLFFKEFIERHQHDHPPSFLCVCILFLLHHSSSPSHRFPLLLSSSSSSSSSCCCCFFNDWDTKRRSKMWPSNSCANRRTSDYFHFTSIPISWILSNN